MTHHVLGPSEAAARAGQSVVCWARQWRERACLRRACRAVGPGVGCRVRPSSPSPATRWLSDPMMRTGRASGAAGWWPPVVPGRGAVAGDLQWSQVSLTVCTIVGFCEIAGLAIVGVCEIAGLAIWGIVEGLNPKNGCSLGPKNGWLGFSVGCAMVSPFQSSVMSPSRSILESRLDSQQTFPDPYPPLLYPQWAG